MDLAVICKEAAQEYVMADNNFEIAGTVVRNSDLLLLKNTDPTKFGMAQNRKYQRELVKYSYPDAEVAELLGNALPYALMSNQVDALVIDGIKAIGIEGTLEEPNVSADVDTYVLIVNKKFKTTEEYEIFVKRYNASVEALGEKSELIKTIKEIKGIELTDRDLEMVNTWKLKLLPIK